MPRIKKRLAMRIAVLYLFWAGVWILISDQILAYLISDARLLTDVSILKGWLFTLVTSLLLFWLVRRGERSHQENLDLLYDIVEGTRDAIFVKDLRGRYVLINSGGADLAGQPVSAILGQDDSAIFPPDHVHRIQHADQTIIETGIAQQTEETVWMQGRRVTLLSFKYPRLDRQGRVRGVIGISRDISNRKRLEEEREQLLETLNARNQELEALNLITANAISTLQLDALLNLLLDRLTSVLRADLGLIFLTQDDGALQLAACMSTAQLETTQDEGAIAHKIANIIATTGKILDVDDIQQNPNEPKELQVSANSHHILGIPLRHQGQQVGVLQVQWFSPHTSSQREIQLLEIAAERCALAILNARLFERTQHLQQRLQLQFDCNPLGCITSDPQGYIKDWNPAAERIFGYTKAEVLGLHPSDLIIPAGIRPVVEAIFSRLGQGDVSVQSCNHNLTKDRHTIICDWSNTPLKQADGQIVGFLSMVQDVTERVRNEEQLRQYAYYDSLTQLPLRRFLVERLNVLLLEPPEKRPVFALLHLDLVRYKMVKYILGHQLAEQLLIGVSDRLQATLPEGSLLARIGTDEFVILLENLPHSAAVVDFVTPVQQVFAHAFRLGDNEIFMHVRIGIVLSSDCEGDAEDFLRAADIAMHQSKVMDQIPYVRYEPMMQNAALHRLQLDSDMRCALERQEFALHYQPLVSLVNSQLLGFEALLRWPRGTEWTPPDQVISLAEETGFIVSLGRWVLERACQDLQRWRSLYPEASSLFVAVNLSPRQLIQPDFVDMVEGILQSTQLPPTCLKMEITETAVMEKAETVSPILEHLKQCNITLSIDDFGTGYSSLSQLHEFPFDTLKIDRSFVQRLTTDLKSREVVRSIVVLAHTLGMDLVAEGVETSEQLSELQELGCDRIQGYFISHPLPLEEAEILVNQNNWMRTP
ncbi:MULTISPECIES: EAL domain-containing protein [unclassified Leptolyngbya]|uniref:EAL domain-containing protein n=1 Tax=unclassified Leptolyngbya TaxID=2650499 RepID=UPI0016884FAB|nr:MULTISPECIES: EAL domain-containing protein [unclassified Leptolyngbya]MBD1912037.1 EAL domain-containing protein [Leptolyngbya sp. FACHB-8]MBD2155407.1 EAL domain-containing protein [Leptolyngbya sp. FACHB-16]